MIIEETNITFNGVPLEHLGTQDMLHFAKYINADLENIKLDRQSLFATIQDCFLRRKERHVVDMYVVGTLRFIV